MVVLGITNIIVWNLMMSLGRRRRKGRRWIIMVKKERIVAEFEPSSTASEGTL